MPSPDRLYSLLPLIYRQHDVQQGYPLRDLLRIIAEQVDVVEADITQLYENWFIETCQDWVVPYIGELIGYRSSRDVGEAIASLQNQQRNSILIPRKDVANKIRYGRRKGTLALLELLAQDVAGWSARAVEFYKLLGWTQHLNHLRPAQGQTINLRRNKTLACIGTPFDTAAHTIDIRHIQSPYQSGRFNLTTLGLFVWRLNIYSVDQTDAARNPRFPTHHTFSALGNDAPLYTKPDREPDPTQIAEELNLPTRIRRRAFERNKAAYYGVDKSLCLFDRPGHPIPIERIIVADLTNWDYRPQHNQVVIDPELGRIVFPARQLPNDLKVLYHYAFSMDIGGGRYPRSLSNPMLTVSLFQTGHFKNPQRLLIKIRDRVDPLSIYLHGQVSADFRQQLEQYDETQAPSNDLQTALMTELNQLIQGESLYTAERFAGINLGDELLKAVDQNPSGSQRVRINRLLLEAAYAGEIAISYRFYQVVSGDSQDRVISDAIAQWQHDGARCAVIELADSGVYREPIRFTLQPYQSLEIRAAENCRPIIRLPIMQSKYSDDFLVTGGVGSRLTLNGLLICGRGIQIVGDVAEVLIHHSTLVPGWDLEDDCEPCCGTEPSITLRDGNSSEELSVTSLSDTSLPVCTLLKVESSIIGTIVVNQDQVRHDPVSIQISNSILDATSCDLEAISSPDCFIAHAVLTIQRSTVIGRVLTHAIALAENSIFYGLVKVARSQIGCMRFCYAPPKSRTPRRYSCQPDLVQANAPDALKPIESDRVRPQFNSTRYGNPTYVQLAKSCAIEITQGADDESEMGVFHDLYQPQRLANLQTRLNEFTPASVETGIILAN